MKSCLSISFMKPGLPSIWLYIKKNLTLVSLLPSHYSFCHPMVLGQESCVSYWGADTSPGVRAKPVSLLHKPHAAWASIRVKVHPH